LLSSLSDFQQDTHHPISKIVPTFILAYAQNPSINFEVFIHKADHWDADWQDEDFREITGRVMDEIADFSDWASLADTHPNVRFPSSNYNHNYADEHNGNPNNIGDSSFNVDADAWLETLTTEKIRFWLTSIHNYTIYEAWSKVIQRLMEDIYGTIEGLLNTFGQVRALTR
jgi:Ras-related GTP-binding protein C/D